MSLPTRAILAAALGAALLPLSARAQRSPLPPRATVAQQVDSLVRARLAHPQGPASMSVTILRGGDPLVHQAWGTADAAANRPATTAMTYRIGSVSKQFTAALILKLVDGGGLSLRDTLGRHLTGLRPEWRPLTIDQLLNPASLAAPCFPRCFGLQRVAVVSMRCRLPASPPGAW